MDLNYIGVSVFIEKESKSLIATHSFKLKPNERRGEKKERKIKNSVPKELLVSIFIEWEILELKISKYVLYSYYSHSYLKSLKMLFLFRQYSNLFRKRLQQNFASHN